jgi:autophagy-related protein 9
VWRTWESQRDSHGSEGLPLPPSNDDNDEVHEEYLAADGGVGSELGDSYVDGKRSKAYALQQDDGDEDDEMKDGGVLGLLAQIYGTKEQGPAQVI